MTKIRDIEQVVNAAAKVFAEKGFEAARLEDIAAEVGVLQGSLYYHIGSKAELLFLVQRRRLRTIVEEMESIAASGRPVQDKVSEGIRVHLLHLDRYHPESSQWFTEPSRSKASDEGREEIRVLNRTYVETWARILQEGIDAGLLRHGFDAGVMARAIVGMCNWLPRGYRKDGAYSIDDLADMVISMVLGGLVTTDVPADDSGVGRMHAQT